MSSSHPLDAASYYLMLFYVVNVFYAFYVQTQSHHGKKSIHKTVAKIKIHDMS